MHVKSGLSLAFAAAITGLLILFVICSIPQELESLPDPENRQPAAGHLLFTASIPSSRIRTVSYVTIKGDQLPADDRQEKTDPVVVASNDLEIVQGGSWQIDMNPEDSRRPSNANPFQINGTYQADDISASQSQNKNGETRDVSNQEPQSSSAFRSVSGPTRPPHIRRASEVITRPRSTKQPIAEIAIPEWDPKAAWGKPTALVTELDRLSQLPETASWAIDTRQLIKLLHWTESINDSQCEIVFGQLAEQLQLLDEISMAVSTTPVTSPAYVQGPFATDLRTLHYSIARRLVIWQAVYELAKQNRVRMTDLDDQQISQMILASQSRLSVPGVGSQWASYLLLDDLQAAFNSLQPNDKQKRSAARATLARLYSSVLSPAQKQFLTQQVDDQFVKVLRDQAAGKVDLSEALRWLEKHESDSSGYTSHRLNDIYQDLIWSNDPTSQDLAAQFEGHYRNANFRVSVSDRLINRLLPQSPEFQQPISENIMGAQVQGNSRIQNRLLIRLIPDNLKVNLRLESNGLVRSLTQARRSGFVIDNVGHSRFQVFKRIGFHRGGIESEAPTAVSDTNSQIVGMRSNLDPIPVVGWVARRIAENKVQESAPMTDQLTRQKLEEGAKQQIETEVQSQLSKVSDYLFVNMLQPLIALEVEPTPLEMRTTNDRIIMRYRLAGRDQMASHTARPHALASSLLSVQFHESVFNNLLDRIEISGREFTAQELAAHLQEVFRSQQAVGSKEIDHEANFVFAPYDPMRIEFKDSKIEISLNLKKFRVGKGKTWKNLSVRATFNPKVQGTKIILVRDDEGIRLSGANLKMRDHVVVRTVFTALFRDHYEMNALPEKFLQQFGSSPLEISQLVLNDGWIGLSLSDAPRTAATFSDQR